MGGEESSPSACGKSHHGWHPPWPATVMAGIAKGPGMVLIILPRTYDCLSPGVRGGRGKKEEGKGHCGFRVACPGGKPWDVGTSA
jgi:hypothetical protein